MKTVKDLCKATGVTRKTLRGYNEIGLLCPTNGKGEHGESREQGDTSPWLYEDSALQTLRLILIFVEAGYDRREIKKILDSIDSDEALREQYENLKNALYERRKRIDGMINYLDIILSISLRLPEAAKKAFEKEDFLWLNENNNFSELLSVTVDKMSGFSRDYIDRIARYLPYLYQMMAIDYLRDEYSPDSKEVQKCVHSFILDVMKQMDLENEVEPEDDVPLPEEVMLFVSVAAIMSVIKEISSDPDAQEVVKMYFKEGNFDFVREALQYYYNKYKYVDTLYDLGVENDLN